MSRSILIVSVVLLSADTAFGQVVVENLYVPSPIDTSVSIGPLTGYTDMPETEKTVTIPAGTAVIEWDLFNVIDQDVAKIRPVVGASFPSVGLGADTGRAVSGAWVFHTDGGTMTVKLQAESALPGLSAIIGYLPTTSISWTLTVYPDAEPVPAVSTVGLGIMVVLLLAGGALVLNRRQQQAA